MILAHRCVLWQRPVLFFLVGVVATLLCATIVLHRRPVGSFPKHLGPPPWLLQIAGPAWNGSLSPPWDGLPLNPDGPLAFTEAAGRPSVPPETVVINGVVVTFLVREQSHLGLVHQHLRRELSSYSLLRDSIEVTRTHTHTPSSSPRTGLCRQSGADPSLPLCTNLPLHLSPFALSLRRLQAARAANPSWPPLVLDIGANHGLYALYAAVLGASVVAVEPQKSLCRLINQAAALNGISHRLRLFNAAALDSTERVRGQSTTTGPPRQHGALLC